MSLETRLLALAQAVGLDIKALWTAVNSKITAGTASVMSTDIANAQVTTLKLGNNAVTNVKAADMAQGTLKGRASAGTGDPEDLTAEQAKVLLGVTLADLGASGASVGQTPVFDGTQWVPQTPAAGSSPDPLDLAASNPAAPAANTVRVFGRKVGGRMMAAFKGPSGLDSSLQPYMGRNKVRFSVPQGNGTVIAAVGLTLTATGTATAASVATTNLHTGMARLNYLVTTAATTAVAGARYAAAQFLRGSPGGKLGGWHMTWRFGPATGAAANATRRIFAGFTSSTSASTDVDPSTLVNVCGVGADAADTNYQFMYRTGTGTVVKVDTGIPKTAADSTEVYELTMFCAPGGTEVHFEFTDLTDDVVVTHTASASLPAATTLLALAGYCSVGGTSSVIGFAHMGLYIETDY